MIRKIIITVVFACLFLLNWKTASAGYLHSVTLKDTLQYDSSVIYKDVDAFNLDGLGRLADFPAVGYAFRLSYKEGRPAKIEMYEQQRRTLVLPLEKYDNGLYAALTYNAHYEGRDHQEYIYYIWTKQLLFLTVNSQADLINSTVIPPETSFTILQQQKDKISYSNYHYRLSNCAASGPGVIFKVDIPAMDSCFQFSRTAVLVYQKGKYYKKHELQKDKFWKTVKGPVTVYCEGPSLLYCQLKYAAGMIK